jgi:hypothetical protein
MELRHLLNVLKSVFPRVPGSKITELPEALLDFGCREVPTVLQRTNAASFPPAAMHPEIILSPFFRAAISPESVVFCIGVVLLPIQNEGVLTCLISACSLLEISGNEVPTTELTEAVFRVTRARYTQGLESGMNSEIRYVVRLELEVFLSISG